MILRASALRLLCLVAAAATLSCAKPTSFDFDPTFDFSTLRSYSWLPPESIGEKNPVVSNSLFEERVHTAVDAELAAKGYDTAETEPDFKVRYHAAIQQKIDIDTYPAYGSSYGLGYGTETVVRSYDEGTLILDVASPDGSRLLWRGTIQARIHSDDTPEERSERVRDAVRTVLAEFPPGS